MSFPELIHESTKWLVKGGLAMSVITLIASLFKWGPRFRLVGVTAFTFLLAASSWAFNNSYKPPSKIEGALYVPVVFDNGGDLVVAQAPEDFPKEAIQPSLKQLSNNLRGAGRGTEKVHIKIRQVLPAGDGISMPVVIGEVVKELRQTQPLLEITQERES